MTQCELIVFDMAGTTIHDTGEVENCFQAAADETDLPVTSERILSMMGWSKRLVFKTLWTETIGEDHSELETKIDSSYDAFRRILENHYETNPVRPADGCLDCFDWLREHNIKIALTTGFYRRVADIILQRVGWNQGLDENYVGTSDSIIQASITSDMVQNGRPAPDMIHKAMTLLDVTDPKRVVKIGDTPSDLQAGKNAGCQMSLAVTNGSHTQIQLETEPNDGLLGSVAELKDILL